MAQTKTPQEILSEMSNEHLADGLHAFAGDIFNGVPSLEAESLTILAFVMEESAIRLRNQTP